MRQKIPHSYGLGRHPSSEWRKVDVLLATESTPIHPEVYTRWEEWTLENSVSRFRDADVAGEQPIYDAGAITRAEARQRKSRRNIRGIKREPPSVSCSYRRVLKRLRSGAYPVAEKQ